MGMKKAHRNISVSFDVELMKLNKKDYNVFFPFLMTISL